MACTIPPDVRAAHRLRSLPGRDPGRSRGARRVLREAVVVLTMLGLYEAARLLGGHDIPAAFRHAERVVQLEQWLHLPSESQVQAGVLQVPDLVRVLNSYYAWVHLPLTGLTLLWLLLRRPATYPVIRTALFAATGIGLAVYLLLPVAPPRMLPGFTDTGALYGQSVYSKDSLADQYAAMPSLHVGWAVIVATALILSSRTHWRWLWLLHPALTVLVVISTGNHYWLDALAGALLAATLLVVSERRTVRACAALDAPEAAEDPPELATAGRSSSART